MEMRSSATDFREFPHLFPGPISSLFRVQFLRCFNLNESEAVADFVESAAQQGLGLHSVCSCGHEKDTTVPKIMSMFELRQSVVNITPDLDLKYVSRN